MRQDTKEYYGTISRAFHWIMALCFAFMLFTALAWNINEDYYSLMGYHKSIGFILMILVVLRFIWAMINFHHRPEGGVMVKLGHLALYGLMLAVPAIGLVRQYGSARGPLEVFGLEIMAKAPEKIEWMNNLGNMLHGKLGIVLFIFVFGHIAMAILHQLKGEKIMNRMIGH